MQHSSCTFGQTMIKFSAQNLAIATRGFGGFCQFFQANKKTVPHIRTTVGQWLRCCAPNRKVAGSIPAGVTGIFY